MDTLLFNPKFTEVLVVIILWSLLWKGLALWTAAKKDSKGWFIAILLINTVGILDIIYIFAVAKKSLKDFK